VRLWCPLPRECATVVSVTKRVCDCGVRYQEGVRLWCPLPGGCATGKVSVEIERAHAGRFATLSVTFLGTLLYQHKNKNWGKLLRTTCTQSAHKWTHSVHKWTRPVLKGCMNSTTGAGAPSRHHSWMLPGSGAPTPTRCFAGLSLTGSLSMTTLASFIGPQPPSGLSTYLLPVNSKSCAFSRAF
jgi:hypothetical protein